VKSSFEEVKVIFNGTISKDDEMSMRTDSWHNNSNDNNINSNNINNNNSSGFFTVESDKKMPSSKSNGDITPSSLIGLSLGGMGSTNHPSPKGKSQPTDMVYLHITPKPFELLELFRGYLIYYKYFIEEKDIGWNLFLGIATGRPALDIKLILAMHEVDTINMHRRLQMAQLSNVSKVTTENKGFDDRINFSSTVSPPLNRSFYDSSYSSVGNTINLDSYNTNNSKNNSKCNLNSLNSKNFESIFIDENSFLQTLGYLQEVTLSEQPAIPTNSAKEPLGINITFYEEKEKEKDKSLNNSPIPSLAGDENIQFDNPDTSRKCSEININASSSSGSDAMTPPETTSQSSKSYIKKGVENVPCKGLDLAVRRRISLLFKVVMLIFALFCLLFSFAGVSVVAFLSRSIAEILQRNLFSSSNMYESNPQTSYLRTSQETFQTISQKPS
jgi:hypothetical protein